MNEKKARFVTLEGIDRCGKSTQSRLLKRNLDRHGINCLLTSEPGGAGALGSALRELLLNPTIERDEVTAAMLFSADRHEHVKATIQTALDNNRWVVCDRYVDSTFAYQGGGGSVPMELLQQLSTIATRGLMPDLTVLLSLDAAKRSKRNPKLDYYDRGLADFDTKISGAFDELAIKEPKRFVVIDGSQSIDIISTQIFSVIKKRFLTDKT